MKQYNDEFLNCFESINPEQYPSTKKEIDNTYNSVLEKIGLKNKSHLKRGVKIILIAAAVLACTVVTAAANSFEAGDFFKSFFESEKTNIIGKNSSAVLSDNQLRKANETGKTPNYTVTDNGTTVQVRAISGDKTCAYIYLDVTAPKDFILDKDEYVFEDMPIDFKIKHDGGSSIGWHIITQEDENPNDNKKSFIISIGSAGLNLQDGNIELTLRNLAIPGKKLTCYPIIKGEWVFDLKLDYTTSFNNIEINKVTHFSNQVHKDMYTTIKNVCISNFSVSVNYTNPKFIKGCASLIAPNMIVKLKDGTEYQILTGAGTGNSKNYTISYEFGAPMDFSKVEKITLGDVDIPISQ